MAVSLDEVNFLILKYLQESGFDHTAYIFETESFLQSSLLNKTHVPPGALISVLQRSLSYIRMQKAIQRAKKDPKDPIHDQISAIEEAFPPPKAPPATHGTDDSDIIATSAIHHPYGQKPDNSEPIPITPNVASILTGHMQSVYCCCWSPSGDRLVTAGGDGIGIIWSIDDQGNPTANVQLRFEFQNKGTDADHDIAAIDISKDGSLIAIGSFDRCVYLFDKEGKQLKCYQDHKLPVFGVKFNPSGNLLVTVSSDRTAILWDVTQDKPKQVFDMHNDAILGVSWLNDKIFATAGADGLVVKYDLSDGSTMLLKGHTGKVNSVAWSFGGVLASASEDKTVRIWNEDGSCKHILHEHTNIISDVKWKPESNRILASGSCDQNVMIWDAETTKKLSSTMKNDGEVMVIEFSPNGEYIAAGDGNGHVMISRVVDAAYVCSFTGISPVFDIKWDKTGRNLAVCFDDSTVAIIHMEMFLKQ